MRSFTTKLKCWLKQTRAVPIFSYLYCKFSPVGGRKCWNCMFLRTTNTLACFKRIISLGHLKVEVMVDTVTTGWEVCQAGDHCSKTTPPVVFADPWWRFHRCLWHGTWVFFIDLSLRFQQVLCCQTWVFWAKHDLFLTKTKCFLCLNLLPDEDLVTETSQ